MEAANNKKGNIEKWSGFFKSDIEADSHLKEQLELISTQSLIVSAKKEHVPDMRHGNHDVECHGLFLFKFTVITSPKQNGDPQG